MGAVHKSISHQIDEVGDGYQFMSSHDPGE
jgi:hypothetical protein